MFQQHKHSEEITSKIDLTTILQIVSVHQDCLFVRMKFHIQINKICTKKLTVSIYKYTYIYNLRAIIYERPLVELKVHLTCAMISELFPIIKGDFHGMILAMQVLRLNSV